MACGILVPLPGTKSEKTQPGTAAPLLCGLKAHGHSENQLLICMGYAYPICISLIHMGYAHLLYARDMHISYMHGIVALTLKNGCKVGYVYL